MFEEHEGRDGGGAIVRHVRHKSVHVHRPKWRHIRQDVPLKSSRILGRKGSGPWGTWWLEAMRVLSKSGGQIGRTCRHVPVTRLPRAPRYSDRKAPDSSWTCGRELETEAGNCRKTAIFFYGNASDFASV